MKTLKEKVIKNSKFSFMCGHDKLGYFQEIIPTHNFEHFGRYIQLIGLIGFEEKMVLLRKIQQNLRSRKFSNAWTRIYTNLVCIFCIS